MPDFAPPVPGLTDRPGYTVIDTETTGKWADSNRVVELGVVYVSASGELQGEWGTLINPGRDVGPTQIHGISNSDVADAPTFEQVAPYLVRAAAGRVLVAHNAPFDMGFLATEFLRMGVPLTVREFPALDTLKWARRLLSLPAYKLIDCCNACGIDLTHAHSAIGDAHATALLLGRFIELGGELPAWQTQVDDCASFEWPEVIEYPHPTFLTR